nr:reverse transcriptase [Tanacetum cinerariifolium]
MTGEKPKDWVKWLPLAEYWYNTNFHSSINTTPYEVVFGQPPPLHIPYVAKDSNVEAVDRTLQAKEQTIQLLKFNLKKAQDRMKSQADKKRSGRQFKEGNRAVVFGLIQWSNGTEEDVTWEVLSDIVERYPEFELDP